MLPVFSRIALKLRLKKKPDPVSKTFMPWDKVQNVALIISSETGLNKSVIDSIVADTKKFVEVYFIETRSKEASFGDWNCFIKKDKSFFNLPKKEIEKSLRQKKFDLVINTCSAHNLFSAAISSALPAPFKCAASSRFQDANLVVKRESADLAGYLRDTVRYLKMIRS